MSDDYLWDRSGDPDPEIEKLEQLLGRYRFEPDGKRVAHELESRAAARDRSRWPWILLVGGGVVAAAAAAIVLFLWRPWTTGYRLHGQTEVFVVQVGDWIEAFEPSRLEIGGLGEVELEVGARVRVDSIGETHALYLERGKLHAEILAEPRVFQVGSPAGLTIDLGCEYTLEVTESGDAVLAVQTGQVSFAYEGREVYVPAGASCISEQGRGPTPPMFDSTRPEYRSTILALHESGAQTQGMKVMPWDFGMVKGVLDFGEREDALPLFAMMTDPELDPEIREKIFERLNDTFHRPAHVTKEGVLGGDAVMQADWLDNVKHWWR